MNFEPGDIVVIEYYWRRAVIGRSAEVVSVHPQGHPNEEIRFVFGRLGSEAVWYILIDSQGEQRCAAHPWLRKVPPVWTPQKAQMETTAS